MSKFEMNRRNFLSGMGAGMGALAATSMLPTTAFAAETSRPQRFLTYYVPHGWPIDFVDTFSSGSAWLDTSHVLSVFKDYQDKVAVFRGVSTPGANGHGGSHFALNAGGHGKTTLDVIVAKHLNTTPWKAHVCANDYFARLSFENGQPAQSFGKPLDLLDQVFGNAGQSAESASLESRLKKSLFDLSEAQLQRLSNNLSHITKEQTRLSTHIESIREVKARTEQKLANAALNTDINALRIRQAHTAGMNESDQQKTAYFLDGHLDVIAAGLTTGAMRVATITNHGSGGNYIGNFENGPGVEGNIHMNSHAGNTERRKAEYAKNLIWYLERLKGLVDRLNIPDPLDPGRTVLDNTTILYTSEMCDGAHIGNARNHNIGGKAWFTYFPYVVIGGTAGKLKTGGVIETQVNNEHILQTLAHSFGATFTKGSVLPQVLA